MLQPRLSLTLALMLCAAACGGARSPVAPESTATPPSGAGAAPGGATIAGSVRSGGSPLTSAGSGAAMTGLVVTIAGTSISSGLDAAGRFSLAGVPPGDVQLQFSGPVSATLPVNEVQPSETITMVVSVTPSSVVVESQLRSAGGEEQIEGRIESLPPVMPAGSLKVAGRTIATDASTVIRDETGARGFSDLAIAQRVHVKGRTSGASLLAASILIQDAVEDEDDEEEDEDDEDDGQDESASIHGTLTVLTGTTPNLTLTVGGTTVRTNADTTVKRRGDVQTLAALTVGQDLHVVGERQSNGSLDARKIEINGDAPGGAFEIEGPVGGLQGGCPIVTFKVNGCRVRTSAETKFESVTCAALKSGDKVQVKGKAETDGTVVAEIVKKK